jgi:hypothetical protein
VKLPDVSAIFPLTCVEVTDKVPEPTVRVQREAVHPGPLKASSKLPGSKAVPAITKLNVWPCTGELGAVVILLSCGVGIATTNDRVFEVAPLDAFCTATA